MHTRIDACILSPALHQIRMQSSILSGGVAVAVSMPAVDLPWEAMAIGFTAAVVSTLGVRYLKVYTLQMHCERTVHTHCLTPVRQIMYVPVFLLTFDLSSLVKSMSSATFWSIGDTVEVGVSSYKYKYA